MPESGVIRRWKKRRQRRHHRHCRKVKIALAVFRLLQFLHHASRGTHGFPVHAVFARDHQAGVQRFRVAQDFRKQVRFGIAVPGVHHRRANRCGKLFRCRQCVVLLEKRHRLLGRQSLRVFRKRLRRNADRLDLVSARFKHRLRAPEHFQRIRHLLLVLRAIQVDERRNCPNFWLLLRRRGFLLCPSDSAVAGECYEQCCNRIAKKSNQGDGRWTHWTVLLVGAQHLSRPCRDAAPHSIQDSPKSFIGWISKVGACSRRAQLEVFTSHQSPVTSFSTRTRQSP